ncbi:MAG: uracil-DNA glycosylase family protein [Gemmatimonadaceae bacterium]
MDARDRLRRYLEQRRELGESEFVLDGLPVEDVLKLVGAKATATRALRHGGEGPARRETARAPETEPPLPQVPSRDAPDASPREPVAPPPAPAVRFGRDTSTDWRDMLRRAGAEGPRGVAEGSPATGPAAAPTESRRPAAGAPAPAGSASLPTWLEALGVPAGLEAGRLRVAELAPDIAVLPSLDDLAAHVAACRGCALHASARNPVPGEGNPQADFLCVGEAPGANEDEQGRPFVGEAGQLLTKILGAIQLSRADVFICNVLKHRPPGNRDPQPDEVLACQPYLLRQIELVKPRVILALGRFAAQTLLQTTTAIGALRGRVHRYHGVPLIVTYHPAALLRNEAWKRPTWDDVKLARRVLDAARAANSSAGTT